MTPPRVTFVSSHSQLGGSERYLEQLVRRLGSEWVHRIIALQSGPLVGTLRRAGYPVDVIETGTKPPAMIAASRKLKSALAVDPPDVVHANGLKAGLVSALAGASPTVWVKHDFSWDGRLTRYIAGRSKLVVGVSGAVLASVREVARTTVVHNGLDPLTIDVERGARELALLTDRPGPKVALIGRLHPVKGHIELIEAAPAIVERHPDVTFLFIGAEDRTVPDHADKLKDRISQLGLQDAVVFVGHHDDVVDLMTRIEVAVIPSVRLSSTYGREGFPLVGLELMATGTATVGYADGGLPELFGDCAVLVEPGDRARLAREIADLLDDPQRRDALGRCGKQRVVEHFTFDGMVESMKRIYAEVAQ